MYVCQHSVCLCALVSIIFIEVVIIIISDDNYIIIISSDVNHHHVASQQHPKIKIGVGDFGGTFSNKKNIVTKKSLMINENSWKLPDIA